MEMSRAASQARLDGRCDRFNGRVADALAILRVGGSYADAAALAAALFVVPASAQNVIEDERLSHPPKATSPTHTPASPVPREAVIE